MHVYALVKFQYYTKPRQSSGQVLISRLSYECICGLIHSGTHQSNQGQLRIGQVAKWTSDHSKNQPHDKGYVWEQFYTIVVAQLPPPAAFQPLD